MMEEQAEQAAAVDAAAEAEQLADSKCPEDEAIDVSQVPNSETAEGIEPSEYQMANATIRTLDGEIAGDELEVDARNYQILLGKIDGLLDRLKLDA